MLLAVAGNGTTRNLITHGTTTFAEHPDLWELHKPMKKGQRVAMSCWSANFDEDEEVFDDRFKFDILRDPNPHILFRGTDAHYCIGVNPARMTVELMFNAIADHVRFQFGRPGWPNGTSTGRSTSKVRPNHR